MSDGTLVVVMMLDLGLIFVDDVGLRLWLAVVVCCCVGFV